MRDKSLDGICKGRPYQAVNEESEIQIYPIGTIYEAYGKRFRYARAAAALTPGKRGCPNLATPPWTGSNATYGLGSDDTVVNGTKGEHWVDVTPGHSHTHTLDEFADGNMVIYPAAGIEIFQHRIIGNDIGLTTVAFRFYIDPPLHEDMVNVPVDISPSPFMNVGAPASVSTNASVVVIPEILVTSGYFFWGQTRGVCWVTPNAAITTASKRDVGFHTNGTLIIYTAGIQRAGVLIACNSSDDDANIMLQLE